MIRELGLLLTADELFAVRIDSLTYIGKIQKKPTLEVSYESLIKEVYSRLVNVDCVPASLSPRVDGEQCLSIAKIPKEAKPIAPERAAPTP